ncbi:MAG: hypothetical protein SGILL_000062 [Bacillariaceae sp.]
MDMDILCGGPLADEQRDAASETDVEDGDATTEVSASITCNDNDNLLECDYDTQCTKLYKMIEEKLWEEVLYFLDTGKYYDANFFTSFLGKEPDHPSVQSRTWVTALDETGDVRWCQLPLHAAITFQAPYSVIARLVQIYPKSVRCADDQDMLPLHYAFRFGAEDDVVALLLDRFPQAVGKRAVKDRLPLDMAHYSSKPERGIIIEHYVEHAVRTAKAEWDNEYEKLVTGMRNDADSNLKQDLFSTRLKLKETEKQLASAQGELEGNTLEGRDDGTERPRRMLGRKKRSSRYNELDDPPALSSRAKVDSNPYESTSEDKGKHKIRGFFGKLRKQQQP